MLCIVPPIMAWLEEHVWRELRPPLTALEEELRSAERTPKPENALATLQHVRVSAMSEQDSTQHPREEHVEEGDTRCLQRIVGFSAIARRKSSSTAAIARRVIWGGTDPQSSNSRRTTAPMPSHASTADFSGEVRLSANRASSSGDGSLPVRLRYE